MRFIQWGYWDRGKKTTAPSSGVLMSFGGCLPICHMWVVPPWTDVPISYFRNLKCIQQNKGPAWERESREPEWACVCVSEAKSPPLRRTGSVQFQAKHWVGRGTITVAHVTMAIWVWQVDRNQWIVDLAFVFHHISRFSLMFRTEKQGDHSPVSLLHNSKHNRFILCFLGYHIISIQTKFHLLKKKGSFTELICFFTLAMP